MQAQPKANDIAVLIETQAYGLAKKALVQTTQHQAILLTLDVHMELTHRGWSASAAREMIRMAMTLKGAKE